MKKHNLTYLGGLAALAVAVGVLGTRVDVDSATDALAETANGTYSAVCNGGTLPTVEAFVPDVTLTLTTAGSTSVVSSSTMAAAISSGVNAESGAFSGITNTTASTGKIFTFSHHAPKMKLSNLACHVENKSFLGASSTAAATATNNDYYIFVSDFTDDFATNQIDVTAGKTIFGPSGVVSTSSVTDGPGGTINDDTSGADGEVVIGDMAASVNVAADRFWQLNHKVIVIGGASATNNSISEGLTFYFTAE